MKKNKNKNKNKKEAPKEEELTKSRELINEERFGVYFVLEVIKNKDEQDGERGSTMVCRGTKGNEGARVLSEETQGGVLQKRHRVIIFQTERVRIY